MATPVAPADSADHGPIGLLSVAVRGVVALLILAAGGVAAWALVATAPAIDLAPVEAVATPVVVFDPTPQPVARRWSGYGTAEALNAADVPARVSAVVERLGEGIRDGTAVEAGQVLVVLESEDFRDEVTRLGALIDDANAQLGELDVRETRLEEQAGFLEADLQLQAQELRRVNQLSERSVATGQDVDRARSQVLSARTALSAMRQSREGIPAQREALTAGRAARWRRSWASPAGTWAGRRSAARSPATCRRSTWRWARACSPASESPAWSTRRASRCR